MDITKVERNNFRSSLLKQIIIRVDYANLSDLTGFVTYIKRVESFAACFVDCRTLNLNKVDLNEPVSIADKKYFPINSMQTETIFRFLGSKIEPIQDASLDIGLNFFCINIVCNENYDCIDKYLELANLLIINLHEYDSFVRITRIGIRKIDGDDYTSLDDAYKIFKAIRFAHDDEFKSLPRMTSKYKGEEQFKTENGVLVNLNRCVEVMGANDFRFTLDIDTYFDKGDINQQIAMTKDQVERILSELLNETSFKIFKEFVSDEFLSAGVEKYKKVYGEN